MSDAALMAPEAPPILVPPIVRNDPTDATSASAISSDRSQFNAFSISLARRSCSVIGPTPGTRLPGADEPLPRDAASYLLPPFRNQAKGSSRSFAFGRSPPCPIVANEIRSGASTSVLLSEERSQFKAFSMSLARCSSESSEMRPLPNDRLLPFDAALSSSRSRSLFVSLLLSQSKADSIASATSKAFRS